MALLEMLSRSLFDLSTSPLCAVCLLILTVRVQLERGYKIFESTHHIPLVARPRADTVPPLCSELLTFRCLNGTAPSYLADSICRVADVEGRRHLRSSATATLIVLPVRRSTLGD